MSYLDELLAHMQEVGNTLNQGGYFNQLKAMGQNAARNVDSNFPALTRVNPTIDDLVNTSLNAGGIGAIRRPKDMYAKLGAISPFGIGGYEPNMFGLVDGEHYLLNNIPEKYAKLLKQFNNYYSKRYATQHDDFVKYIDNGGSFRTPDMYTDYNLPMVHNLNSARSNKLANKLGINSLITNDTTNSIDDTLEMLRNGQSNAHVNDVQKFADALRTKFGGKQYATTPAGKHYENVNDINAISDSTTDLHQLYEQVKHSPEYYGWMHYDDDELDIAEDFIKPFKSHIDSTINSKYYKDTKGTDRRVFYNPMIDNAQHGESLDHIADNLPDNRTLSLTDAIMHSIRQDEAVAARKAKFENSEEFAKSLAKVKNVNTFDDGLSWNRITDPDGLAAEGDAMGHCVGKYCNAVDANTSHIYSLRGADNKPLLTAEWQPLSNKLAQVRGKYNAVPDAQYQQHIDWLTNWLQRK